MATIVNTIRMTMAAALPQKIAFFCISGFKVRAAIAITTALSPDNTILANMMEPKALQKAVEAKSKPKNIKVPCLLLKTRTR